MDFKSAQRQKEINDLEAMINCMEADENEQFDAKQHKMQIDPELQEIQKMGNQMLQQHGQQLPTQQKQVQQQQGQFKSEADKARQENINKLQALIGNLSDDEDDGDVSGPPKIEVDPELQNLMKDCGILSQQYGIENDTNLIPQQQQPKAQVQKVQASGNAAIDQDNQFTVVTDIMSIEALLQEKQFYEKHFLKSKSPVFQKHGQAKTLEIDNFLKTLSQKLNEGKFNAEKYKEIIAKKIMIQQDHFKQAKAEGNKPYVQRLIARCSTMQGEMKAQKVNVEEHFQNVIQKLPIVGSSNINYEIDSQSIKDKVEVLGARNIHYFNLVKFYSKNMQNIKSMEIETKLKPLLAQFKEKMTELLSGKSIKIGQFLNDTAPEISPLVFHGMTEQQYKSKIKLYIQNLKECMELERNFKSMIQGNKFQLKQAEESAYKIQQYEADIFELEQLLENQEKFIPLPIIEEKIEQRNIRVANKEINKGEIQIAFKRLINAKSDKYQVQWSLDFNKQTISEKTDWCDKGMVFGYTKTLKSTEKNPYQNLNKKKISISLYSKGFFSDSSCGNGQLDLEELNTNASCEGLLDIHNKGKIYQLEYGVYIREPIATAQFASGKSKSMRISQRFPEFDKSVGVKDYVSKKVLEIKEPVPEPEKPKEEPKQVEPQQQEKQPLDTQKVEIGNNDTNQQQQMQEEQPQQSGCHLNILEHDESHPDTILLKQTKPEELPQGINLQTILNPENPAMNICVSYYKIIAEDLTQAAITFGQQKKRKEKRLVYDLQDQVSLQNVKLENAVNNGELEQEDYVEELKEIIERDKKLIEFYKSKTGLQQDWVKFLETRIYIVEKEMAGEQP